MRVGGIRTEAGYTSNETGTDTSHGKRLKNFDS